MLVDFADTATVSEDSIQEHSWPQIVSCHFLIFLAPWVTFKIAH